MDWIAQSLGLSRSLGWVFAAVLSGMAITTGVRLWRLWSSQAAGEGEAAKWFRRLLGWWGLTLVFMLAVVFAPWGVLILAGLLSAAGVHEFARLLERERFERGLRIWLFAAVVVQYGLLALGATDVALWLLPIVTPVALSAHLIALGRPAGFTRQVGGGTLAVLLTVYAVSHVVMLLHPPVESRGHDDWVDARGYLVALVLLVAGNDVAQAWCGKWLGKRALSPNISPNKTWAGFIGGIIVTAVLAAGLLPTLTPLFGPPPALRPSALFAAAGIGAALAGLGLLSDLCISAIKREVGVKDTSHLLGEQGGVLDRLDSLLFTAPLFYHGLAWWLGG